MSPTRIKYQLEPELTSQEFADVLNRSTLALRRPVDDLMRLDEMLSNASIVLTARDETGLLVGVSRALSDFSYCTYLSDLAVDVSCQRQGIGKTLIEKTHHAAGLQTTLILLAAPAAQEYYPHIGFQKHDSCWLISAQASPNTEKKSLA